jgi:hypothetical protein
MWVAPAVDRGPGRSVLAVEGIAAVKLIDVPLVEVVIAEVAIGFAVLLVVAEAAIKLFPGSLLIPEGEAGSSRSLGPLITVSALRWWSLRTYATSIGGDRSEPSS